MIFNGNHGISLTGKGNTPQGNVYVLRSDKTRKVDPWGERGVPLEKSKLDQWADRLLDVGKRNNLSNFHDSKSSTAEVLIPDAGDLFHAVSGSESEYQIFQDNDPDFDYHASSEEGTIRERFLSTYQPQISNKNTLLLFNNSGSTDVVVRKLDKKVKAIQQESGINVLFAAFGFVHWREKGTSSGSTEFRAPVLLVPAELSQTSIADPYRMIFHGDDTVVNPTFTYILKNEFGIDMPEYTDQELQVYLDEVQKCVKSLDFTVDSSCRIGLFSFQKINMYKDLKTNQEQILENENVRELLGEEDGEVEPKEQTEEVTVGNPLFDLHNVIDADSSQLEAIAMAKSGRSFVLQGPPGTGKSQTITNIIAECLYDGKKVLFVSEKLAALNVVYNKLSQEGLGQFCVAVHSSKANKKDFIEDIKNALYAPACEVGEQTAEELELEEREQEELDEYDSELHATRPVIGKSLYQLYNWRIRYQKAPMIEWAVPDLTKRGQDYLQNAGRLLEEYESYIPQVGYDYHDNPWYGCVMQDTSYQKKLELKKSLQEQVKYLSELQEIAKEIEENWDIRCIETRGMESAPRILWYLSSSEMICGALLNRKTAEEVKNSIHTLRPIAEEYQQKKQAADEKYLPAVYELDGTALHQSLTADFSGGFSRLFSSSYHNLIKTLRTCRKDSAKPGYEEALAMTEELSELQELQKKFEAGAQVLTGKVGPAWKGLDTDFKAAEAEMDVIALMNLQVQSFGNLTNCAFTEEDRQKFKDTGDRINTAQKTTGEAGKFAVSAFSAEMRNDLNIEQKLVKARECIQSFDQVDTWCRFRTLMEKLTELDLNGFIDEAIRENLPKAAYTASFRRMFTEQWIDDIISSSRVLSEFSRASQDHRVRVFAEQDRKQFAINRVKIRAKLTAQRPPLNAVARGSQLSIVLREAEKKRRQKSIRKLLTEAGGVIQQVKPCFLMSPLSISTYLAPGSVHFDVVIFDEASQIFPQDAIGAIYRGKQLIVVGDSKQMPPSNFFNASLDTDEDNEDDDTDSFESVLDLCSSYMYQLRLKWHYRSRCEQLIAFSNRYFYDGSLVTFPSSTGSHRGYGVDYYHVDGIYDRKSRTNREEAEFIVNLVYRNIEEHPERSMGVVAFNIAQQDLIDQLISERRIKSPAQEKYFQSHQEEPFFVKNLETVQGDERDTIIFSVAYGRDAQGRFLQNFGPLIHEGGERRLNVAVTRAKYNVELVTLIHGTDIDLTRSESVGTRLLREYLLYAEKGTKQLDAGLNVTGNDSFDSGFEENVCDFLRSQGFSVDTQVGCSGYRIDMGVKRPGTSDYVLAVECDGATYHSSKNARDRDRLRQEILERMGWKFYRIWSTDWFHSTEQEKKKLVEAVKEALAAEPEDPEKDVPASESHQENSQNLMEQYEEHPAKQQTFPVYHEANALSIYKHYRWINTSNYLDFVKEILEVEAPVYEQTLLRQISILAFGQERVTAKVQAQHEELMQGAASKGILRKNGFLYLADQTEYELRVSDRNPRPIAQIAPEELAAGMKRLLSLQGYCTRDELFHTIAKILGTSRLGSKVQDQMELALQILDDEIETDKGVIRLKA